MPSAETVDAWAIATGVKHRTTMSARRVGTRATARVASAAYPISPKRRARTKSSIVEAPNSRPIRIPTAAGRYDTIEYDATFEKATYSGRPPLARSPRRENSCAASCDRPSLNNVFMSWTTPLGTKPPCAGLPVASRPSSGNTRPSDTCHACAKWPYSSNPENGDVPSPHNNPARTTPANTAASARRDGPPRPRVRADSSSALGTYDSPGTSWPA